MEKIHEHCNLRNYSINSKQYEFYKRMYEHQDLNFVLMMKEKYKKLTNVKMTMNKALSLLDSFIDPSDPDLDEPNSIHAYQTAERIRKKYPDDKEYQLVGLIHDLGKVLFTFGEPDYAVVGDTFVVGCKLPESIVCYDETEEHPDHYNSVLGIYSKQCGLDNLHLSFGHDEYLYQVLKQNSHKHNLSSKYWDIIRYHSFYPWHDKGSYSYFMNNDVDLEKYRLVKEFNSFDLYSKEDKDFILTDKIKKYYDDLLNEYFTRKLNW